MVKVKNVWPAPYTGIPAVLSSSSLVMFVLAFLIIHYGRGVYDTLGFTLFFTGIAFGLLSAGKEVELKDDRLVLKYGFPQAVINITVREVVEVADLSSLKRGKLFKYFKSQLVAPLLIMLLPILYLPPLTKPLMALLLLVPVVIGFSLLTYFMMTFSDYRRFLNYAIVTLMAMLALIFLEIAMINPQIVSSKDALVMLVLGYVLLIAGFIVFISFAIRRHIILIESTQGHYAVTAASKADAEEFMKTLLKHMVKIER